MKTKLLPSFALALVAVAWGCTGAPVTTPAPASEPEGRVTAGGQPPAGGVTPQSNVITGSIGNVAVGQKGALGNAVAPSGSTNASTATASFAPVAPVGLQPENSAVQANSSEVPGASLAPAPAALLPTDHVGQTVLAPAGSLLTPRLLGTASPTPSPAPSQNSNATNGVTVPAAPSIPFPALNFTPIRVFSPTAAVQVIDYLRVVAVDGTTLYVSTNAGADWTVYQNVGAQVLRCLSFTDEFNGWVAGDHGALLQISINNGILTYTVANSGTSSRIPALYFSATQSAVGFYADEDAGVIRMTANGGQSWSTAMAPDTSVPVTLKSGFRPDSALTALYLPVDSDKSPGAFTTIYQLQGNKFTPLNLNRQKSFSSLSQYLPINVFKDSAQPAPTWYIVSDWSNPTPTMFSADMVTPTQLLHGALSEVQVIDAGTMLGKTVDGKYALSINSGQTWTDPLPPNRALSWVKPMTTTQMWGYDLNQGALYRVGTP